MFLPTESRDSHYSVTRLNVRLDDCAHFLFDLALSMYAKAGILMVDEVPDAPDEEITGTDPADADATIGNETAETTDSSDISQTNISCNDDQLFELIRNHPDEELARNVFDTIQD